MVNKISQMVMKTMYMYGIKQFIHQSISLLISQLVMKTKLHVLIMFYHASLQIKVIPSLMIANFTLQSCCICLIWLREGLGLLFWSRQKTAVGFPFMGTLLSFMLPFNMIFQLVFKYSGKLTLVAVKHKFIFSVFVQQVLIFF